MNAKEKIKHLQRRSERSAKVIGLYKHDFAERLAETKKIFKKKVYTVDIHTHSTYSDGSGTVQENYKAAMNCGLDFFFATDHGSLGQKRSVKKWDNVSWGQEPGAGAHHIGLLHPSKLFVPKKVNIFADFVKAKCLAPFVWIPHPVGWYPDTWYDDESIKTLWTLGDSFAIEVINGANKIVAAYDVFDEKAIAVWDKLLCDGKKVTALGGSDAHGPDEIGTVWTGVYAAKCEAESLLKALNNENCFASEASLMEFSCDKKPMGTIIMKKKGSTIHLSFRVADVAGIASVRIVSGGKIIKEIQAKSKTFLTGQITRKTGAKSTYYRLESTACDNRRAFSTPIYIKPV